MHAALHAACSLLNCIELVVIMIHMYFYRKICGVELGTFILVGAAFIAVDADCRHLIAIAVSIAALCTLWTGEHSRADSFVVVGSKMLGDARSSVAGVSEAASAGPALPNEAGSSRRRIQVIGVRVIEGRVGLFHILIFKGQNSWLVWRSKEQLLSLREELCLNAPGVSVPHLPSAMSGGAGLMLTGGEDSARQMAAFRRHKELVCAWLDILNDTPLLQDSSQFLKFLDDHHDTAPESSSVPVVGSVKCSGQQIKNINPPLHPSESDKFNENPLENNNKNIDAPKAHSTLKKLKSFFKRKHGSSTSALLDVTSETVAVVGDAFTFADEIENCSSSYEAWLRQKQSEYGFSGDSFETFEFTNIDKEQQAQSKDSGNLASIIELLSVCVKIFP